MDGTPKQKFEWSLQRLKRGHAALPEWGKTLVPLLSISAAVPIVLCVRDLTVGDFIKSLLVILGALFVSAYFWRWFFLFFVVISGGVWIYLSADWPAVFAGKAFPGEAPMVVASFVILTLMFHIVVRFSNRLPQPEDYSIESLAGCYAATYVAIFAVLAIVALIEGC